MSLLTILITCTALMTNTIRTQLLCESELGNEINFCCFPNFSDGAPLCPTQYFLIQNNSKVLCSREGMTEAIEKFYTLFSEKPFCTRTCPVGFQASVLVSVLTCTPCNVSCNGNTTETKTNSKDFETSKLPIVLSAVSLTVCCLVLAVVCCLHNKRLYTACRQGQTRHINRGALEMELGIKNGVKLEDLKQVEGLDGRRRTGNGYVRDPTIDSKRGDGIDNDSYDYAEVRIVPRKAYIQKESNEDDDDGDGYQEYTGQAAAATEQEIEDIYANQTVTTEFNKHDKTSQRKSSDNQKTENSHQNQSLLESCNYHENLENEDSYYVNQSIGKQCTNYENVNIKETNMEQMVTVRSNNVKVKTVKDVTAVNTSTINIDHAQNVNIHNTTIVQFINVKIEKPSKESDKKSKTW